MSNSGPAPLANRNSGFGWKMSGPAYCITVCADSGTPMSPFAIARRAVWTPGPSTVSGATPTSSPAACGLVQQRVAARPVDADRLLRPDVLSRGDGLAGDLGVHGRDRQVHHDLDLGVGQHVLAGSPLGHPCFSAWAWARARRGRPRSRP